MLDLFLKPKAMISAALLAAAVGAFFTIQHLRSDLVDVRDDLRTATKAAETYKAAAERAVQDAEELIRSRDAAAAAYRTTLERIASAQGACLDTRIPLDLID
ncbi:hypothetical protein Z949_1863 [Sulfitobacter guttiformis KCTC 32187]|nr:hypothetical protein Z949_1863 [Sulfitobacter guttiformis KCTC 32187]